MTFTIFSANAILVTQFTMGSDRMLYVVDNVALSCSWCGNIIVNLALNIFPLWVYVTLFVALIFLC